MITCRLVIGPGNSTDCSAKAGTAYECEQIVAAVAGTDFVPRRIISQIVERTDGVPLFIEEFTRAVVDSGAVPLAAESPVPSGKLPEPLVPASIHDSLMERLDRLGTCQARRPDRLCFRKAVQL